MMRIVGRALPPPQEAFDHGGTPPGKRGAAGSGTHEVLATPLAIAVSSAYSAPHGELQPTLLPTLLAGPHESTPRRRYDYPRSPRVPRLQWPKGSEAS